MVGAKSTLISTTHDLYPFELHSEHCTMHIKPGDDSHQLRCQLRSLLYPLLQYVAIFEGQTIVSCAKNSEFIDTAVKRQLDLSGDAVDLPTTHKDKKLLFTYECII